ncbi:hemagglutinin repeat-containing protein [Haemophilus sp. HMSC066D03]|uniref:hemagglutinin repeat-containing protein n=1 Tax=Haemophilus sp. HMSC066D03 TaxID=1739280 RepID=UPI0008A3D7EC|nr:hemagglutinin repeat-containing protein [Haemophilus sp. HMSC066D03]
MSLYGGKSVELGATTTETQSQLGRTETGNKQVDRQSELKVTGKGGELSIQSGGDITIKAANVKSAGTVDVNAKGKLLVTTEKQSSKEHYDFSDNHHYHLDKEGEVGSVIEGKEGTRLVGQEETTLRQAKVNSEEGRTIIASKGEVKLEEGRDIEHLDRRNKQTSKGFLTKETEEMRHHHDYDLSKGSEVNGKDVIVYSQDANATVKGSSITAQDGLLVQAKNVNVKEAENHAYVEEHYEKKRSGLASSFKGGVAKVGYEKSKSNLDSKSVSLEAAGSQLTAGTATLVAENVLTVRGSDLNSQDQFDLHAKQVNLEAAKEIHHTEVHKTSKTSGFGLSMVYDPTVKAVDQYKQRQKQGGTETVVGKINSIAEAGADSVELMSRGIVPYLEHKRSKSDKTTVETTAKVTALNAGGQLNVVASEGDIRTQGTQIAAEKGATFLASNNIELGTAENTYTQQANTSDKGFSLGDANKYLFGVHTQRENGDATQIQEVSTTISVGGNNQIVAQKGDIHAKGAKIVSEGKNQLSAEGNVVLDTAVTTQETTQQRKGHAVGEAVISDSERFYGYNRTRFNQDGNFTHHEKAQLASLGDKVEVYAGKDYRQTSAEILSKDKASINAQNIIVDSAFNTDKYKQSESDLKFGQFTRVKSPIIDLINSIESTIKNKNASDRVQAANIMSVAAQAYNLASAFQGQGGASYLIRVESGTGVAHSRKKEDSYQHTSQGNLFNAKEIEFTARGDGSTNAQGNPQLGNINITHADITSVDEKGNRLKDSSVTFNANNLTIDPGKSTVDQHARSQSAGVEVGMAATIGAQTGIGIYARVGGSSSKTNVEGVNYTNSHLNTETLNINTQGDTTLTGTTAKAKTINANVGGNLNIASVQDENKFETKSSGGGLEVEFGWGNNWRVSGYANSEKGESGYKQVKEQAGLFAEEGGYHVNAKNVHLKGAAITSTNPANSELATNKLTFEDIQNESHSDASSMSFSASYSKGGSAPKDNSSSGGSPFSQIGTKMKDSFSSNGPTSLTGSFSGGLPMKESNSDDSVTRATLTEGKITLNKDTTPMLTTAQALGINTDINQANGEVDKPKDVNQILSEQRQISAAVGNIKSAVNTYVDRQKAPLLQEIERLSGEKKELEARQDNTGAALVGLQLKRLEDEAAEWDSGGKYRRAADALTSTIVAALSGQSVKGIAATAAAPYVNVGIKKSTTDESGKVNTVANIAAHALWGAVEANALGGSGTSGALAAGVAELSAPVAAKLSKIINEVSSDESLSSTTAKMKAIVDKIKTIDKGIDSSELSNKEKEILVGITSFIGQVVAQTTSKVRGADSDTASKNGEIGSIVAKNAVVNNLLGSVKFRKRLQERVKKGDKDAIRMLQIEELLKKSGVPDSEIFIDYYDKCGGCDDANKKYSIARNSSLKIITSLVKSGKLSRDDLGLIMRESSNKVLSIDRGNVIGRMEAYDQANIFQHVYDFTQSTNPRKLSPLESEIKDIFNSPFGGGIEGPSSRLKPRKIKTPTYSAQAKYQSVENKGNHEWKQGTLAGENYKKIVDKVPGVVLGRYDATTGPGPIEDLNKRKSFSGGRYATIKLTEDIVAYRAWTPGQSYEFGAYWALEKPRGSLQTTIDSAIIPEWGFLPNKVHIAQANQYTEIVIPAGTIINIGEVGSQSQRGPYVGAKTQLLIEGGAKPEWVVGRGKLQ